MSKKLLSEAQVRRFQSLASIKPLQEMGYYKEEEEQMEEAMHEEEPMEEEMEDAPEMDAGDDMADAPEAPEAGGDEVDMSSDDLADVAGALETLQDKLAPLLDAVDSPAGDMDDEPMPDMGGDDDMPMPDAGDEPEEGDDEDALLELALEIEYQPSQKEIVKEVAKRVARRLVEAKDAQAKLNRALGKK